MVKCEHCGIEFEAKIDIDARFHDKKCRQAYHNLRRKISRLEDIARKAVQDLKEIRTAYPVHESSVSASLDSINYHLQQASDERFKSG